MRIATVLIGALMISACATNYQSSGFTGGYTETRLDENVFRVLFRGNGYTGRERAADFSLLRSAELTLKHGYKYFVIIDGSSWQRISATSASSSTTINFYGSSATANTTYSDGYRIARPRSENTIVCFKEKPEGVFSYNAEFLARSMKDKYSID